MLSAQKQGCGVLGAADNKNKHQTLNLNKHFQSQSRRDPSNMKNSMPY